MYGVLYFFFPKLFSFPCVIFLAEFLRKVIISYRSMCANCLLFAANKTFNSASGIYHSGITTSQHRQNKCNTKFSSEIKSYHNNNNGSSHHIMCILWYIVNCNCKIIATRICCGCAFPSRRSYYMFW